MAYLRSEKSTLQAESSENLSGISHIIIDKLHPAISGKLLDGSTSHSGAYGTAQADGFSYYYTDIKGSKPIKDPRIGAHFGSQRYNFRSLQKLTQETAVHGEEIFSLDGRENIRVGNFPSGSNYMRNNSWGSFFSSNRAGTFLEITGYFNDINIIMRQYTASSRTLVITVNGLACHNALDLKSTQESPLRVDRYVNVGGVRKIDVSSGTELSSTTVLGINTIKFVLPATDVDFHGIELIAQDTTSTATKSKIQIHSQNVVSFGKKFTVDATAHHYNPFGTKGDDSASTIPNNTTGDSVATGWTGITSAYWDSTLDTATSLGLSAWESGGAYYRPVNGGRIVKWVDSNGIIKTSVNMMPPEASAINRTTAVLGQGLATGTHNWSTQWQPQFGNRHIGSAHYSTDFSATTGWTPRPSHATIAIVSGGQSGNCLEMTVVSSYPYATKAFTDLVVGSWYIIRVYVKTGSGNSKGFIGLEAPGRTLYKDVVATSSWVEWQFVFQAEHATQDVILGAATAQSGTWSTNSGTILYDTYSVTQIESPDAQEEYAKTYHVREFGNGSANGGDGAAFADATMQTTSNDDVAYTMDDGLTSFSCKNLQQSVSGSYPEWYGFYVNGDACSAYYTFIGTGFSIYHNEDMTHGGNDEFKFFVDGVKIFEHLPGWIAKEGSEVYCQNLPYGTHIIRLERAQANSKAFIWRELSFHQPKKPPIPEDAVVIADYMLMADYVEQTGNPEGGMISKGVRSCCGGRDIFADSDGPGWTSSAFHDVNNIGPWGIAAFRGGSTNTCSLPYFGTAVNTRVQDTSIAQVISIDGSNKTTTARDNTTESTRDMRTMSVANSGVDPGSHTVLMTTPAGYVGRFVGYDIVTPIHTSSHYQTFETPNVQELVGGDRNMEQTNLVVTPDGKTWDEVSRDTSYISKDIVFKAWEGGDAHITATSVISKLSGYRGKHVNEFMNPVQKDSIAIGFDRWVILKDGQYIFDLTCRSVFSTDLTAYVLINATSESATNCFRMRQAGDYEVDTHRLPVFKLKRFDFIYIKLNAGTWGGEDHDRGFAVTITKQ